MAGEAGELIGSVVVYLVRFVSTYYAREGVAGG